MNASSIEGCAAPFVVLVLSLLVPFVPFVFEGGSVKASSIDGWAVPFVFDGGSVKASSMDGWAAFVGAC